ncbi:MAG: sodium ion-translocating decarboxylase subunit beta [Magnetococcales bacterium]|nr:sodium ion-translocating decarboxylase subunit beta [Magnetococcales bacterium]
MESFNLLAGLAHLPWGSLAMMGVGGVLLVLATMREFESVFLFALGLAILLTNLPGSALAEPGGLLYLLYDVGVHHGLLPALFCLSLGILADFRPLIALPALLFVGAAAQMGVFITLLFVLLLNVGLGLHLDVAHAALISQIGSGYAPSLLFGADRLAPELLGTVVMVLYANMALLPLLQSPIAHRLTTEEERQVVMTAIRPVSRWERMLFPGILMVSSLLIWPFVAPVAALLGLLALGNLLKEAGIVAAIATRIPPAISARLLSLITLLFGLAVGSRLSAAQFLSLGTVGILCLGVVACGVGSASGILMGKWLYRRSNGQINPLLGAAGLAVVPLAARMVGKLEAEARQTDGPHAPLLAYALGTNLAGVIGSVVATGILLAILGGK